MRTHSADRKREPAAPRAKRYLGQNFLVDPHVRDRILAACEIQSDDNVVEIGPGQGALTQQLFKASPHFRAIEKDRELVELLHRQFPQAKDRFIHDDILRFNFATLADNLVIIGNLPFNISTPIIERLIAWRQKIKTAYLTVQWEFGQRLTGQPPTKDYGALSCFVQYFADVKILFKISPGCFRPVPKVTSCFLKITFRPPALPAISDEQLFKLIKIAFLQRRKMVVNVLANHYERELLTKNFQRLGIPLTARAENISLRQFVELANQVTDAGSKNGRKEC